MAGTFIKPRPARKPDSLRSGPINCPSGVETSLVTVRISDGAYPYLESAAYYTDSVSTAIEFRRYINGVRDTGWEATRNTQLGQIGAPRDLPNPQELSPGAVVEVRLFQTSGGAISGESDGDINYYDQPL